MLWSLFLVLAIIHFPVLRSFSDFDFYESDDQAGFLLSHSLGNMGFSKTECQITSMIKGNTQAITCKSGLITELVDWGIATKFEDQMQCRRKANNFCLEIFNDAAIHNEFDKSCKGKTDCTLNQFDTFLNSNNQQKHKECADSQSRIYF